jgi:hypothetical protein
MTPILYLVVTSILYRMVTVVRAAGTSVGHLVQCVLYCPVSDVEAVLCTLSLHLPVVHTAFLLCMPPSSCYHRETTTYREVPSTVTTMLCRMVYHDTAPCGYLYTVPYGDYDTVQCAYLDTVPILLIADTDSGDRYVNQLGNCSSAFLVDLLSFDAEEVKTECGYCRKQGL